MSNSAVGGVYQTIIDEVINSSRVDFEESGVEEAVLEELRQGWQRKLTQLDVAQFPWDPKPNPTPAAQPAPATTAAPPAAHAPAPYSSPQLNSVPQGLSLPTGSPQGNQQNGVKAEPGIKQEPGVAGAAPHYQAYNGGIDSKGNIALHRATQQLQAQYGQRAQGSINAMQQQQQPQSQTQGQAPQQGQQGMNPQQQQQQMYRQQMAAATAQQQQQGAPGQPPVGNGQTDGAGDDEDAFEGVIMERGAGGDLQELGRVEIDRMLHEQILAKAKSMEGGGLMLPLKEATRHTNASASRPRTSAHQAGAFDGGDDDEDDEDAINSDLDDPDEDRDDDEVDDEGLGHIMLCMYDKVQRVKNKWKCTLKDGVLTVNGKEYVFHKATGEYEW